MPNKTEVTEWLQGFTYKPDWSFRVGEPDIYSAYFDMTVTIYAKFWTPDTDYISNFTDLTLRYDTEFQAAPSANSIIGKRIPWGPIGVPIMVPPPIDTRPSFYEWFINSGIPRIESHEILEWARVNGKCIFDPHPDGGSVSRGSMSNYTLGDIDG